MGNRATLVAGGTDLSLSVLDVRPQDEAVSITGHSQENAAPIPPLFIRARRYLFVHHKNEDLIHMSVQLHKNDCSPGCNWDQITNLYV